jgi:hypothetical protein
MGIKKNAFLRDMVRVVVAFEQIIALWTELFNRFREASEEAFDYVIQNRNRYEKLLLDIVPKVDPLMGNSLQRVLSEFKQTFSLENDKIKKKMRASFQGNELGDLFITEFRRIFRKVNIDNEAIEFLRSIPEQMTTVPDDELMERINLFFRGKKNFVERYREMYDRFKQGAFQKPTSPYSQQYKKDISEVGVLKTANISPDKIILMYLNSLDQR